MVSERTRVAARGRGCRGARAGRAPRRRARGSAARDAPSGARDSAPISSARWGGERGSRQRSGERRRGRVPQRARAPLARRFPPPARGGTRRGRVRATLIAARGRVSRRRTSYRAAPAAALSSSAPTPSAGRAVRAAIARGVLGRVRRSPPFPERPRVPASVRRAAARVSSRPERRPRAPRVPPLPRRSNAIGAVERESHLAARGAECAGPARRFAGDFFTSGGGTGRSFGSCAGIGYRADSDECLAISSE